MDGIFVGPLLGTDVVGDLVGSAVGAMLGVDVLGSKVGEAVGAIGAQSISEPGTQMTLKVSKAA